MGFFSKEVEVKTVSQEPIDDLPPHQVNGKSTIIEASSVNKERDSVVSEFISKAPKATYFIDSSKDVNESLLCRQKEGGGQTCLKLSYNYTELFKTMQKFEFYCGPPTHKVEANYFECRKIT